MKYILELYPDYYFIIRNDKWSDAADMRRVCLFKDKVINNYLHGHSAPAPMLVTNELLDKRTVNKVYWDMMAKVTLMVEKEQKKLISI